MKSKDSRSTFCTIEGCGRPRRARMLCATHYNQTLPNRHRKILVVCDCCGNMTPKDARAPRYEGTFCGDLCKNYSRWGGCSTRLPSDHWARWYGRTSKWVPPVTRNSGVCEWCGDQNARTRLAAYCSPTCKTKAKRVRRIGREHGAVGAYTWAQVVRLWVAMGKRCAYCQEHTPLHAIQAEHVTPLSRGGDNHIGNILPSCGPCNSDKRDLYLSEWNADRTRRGLDIVFTTWSDDDPRFTHLTHTHLRMSA